MKWTYDPKVDAAYLYVVPSIDAGESVEQVEITRADDSTIVLDFDATGHLLGLEVLGASAVLRPDVIPGLLRPIPPRRSHLAPVGQPDSDETDLS